MAKIDTLNINGTSYDIAVKDLINIIYPVGSIYMSVNNVSPATFLGGTWEPLQNRFLVGAGDTYAVNATGGEANHTLTQAEMPSHAHTQYGIAYGGANTGTTHLSLQSDGNLVQYRSDGGVTWATSQFNGTKSFRTVDLGYDGTTSSTGSGAAHNNLPPYLAVYMWKRTA